VCSAVQVLADETGLPAQMAKRILWSMIREWEKNHERMADEVMKTVHAREAGNGTVAEELAAYMEGIKAQLSGTELWSRTTLRYLV
jgi:aristolochene synthase